MTAQPQSLIAEKIQLESQWNSQFLNAGKETHEMKSIEERIKRILAKLRWRQQSYDSHLFFEQTCSLKKKVYIETSREINIQTDLADVRRDCM